MNAVVIGAAKPGYAEAITRKLIKNGFKVIGTYDTEFEENATKLSKEFSSEKLTLKSLDLSSRNDLKSFVDDIVDPIDAFVFAQFYFDMEIQMILIMRYGIRVLQLILQRLIILFMN